MLTPVPNPNPIVPTILEVTVGNGEGRLKTGVSQ